MLLKCNKITPMRSKTHLPILIVFMLCLDLGDDVRLLLNILCFCGLCFTAKFSLMIAALLPISDTVKSYSEMDSFFTTSILYSKEIDSP